MPKGSHGRPAHGNSIRKAATNELPPTLPSGVQGAFVMHLSDNIFYQNPSDDALSNSLESKNLRTTHFPTPWKAKIIVRRYSNSLEIKII